MTDDNLDDVCQPYCSKCECEPCQCISKCDCDIGMCTHRANCRNNPLKVAQDEMTKASENYKNVGITSNERLIQNMTVEQVSKFAETSIYGKEIWNKAIEAAAQYLEKDRWATVPNIIRELKKMSVKELKFEDYPWKIKITSGDKTIFRISTDLPANGAIFVLDRNQAHLLMLYLQEHLGYQSTKQE